MISERMATLRELQTVYDLEDLMTMHEVIMVRRSNEYFAAKAAEAKAKMRRR